MRLGTVLTKPCQLRKSYTSLGLHGLSRKGLDAKIDESVFQKSQMLPGFTSHRRRITGTCGTRRNLVATTSLIASVVHHYGWDRNGHSAIVTKMRTGLLPMLEATPIECHAANG